MFGLSHVKPLTRCVMRNRCLFVAAALALGLGCQPHPASAQNQVLDPIQQRNLAVYLIRGDAKSTQPAIWTLDRALGFMQARVHSEKDGPLTVDNYSERAIFVQSGTLLRGGTQDQVVTKDLILPPHATNIPLNTFCIDPFRETARDGESRTEYSTDGSLFPWPTARLTLIESPFAKGATIVRRAGIWWSIDTLRSALSARIGEMPEPAQIPTWQVVNQRALESRRSPWTTSLVLALESPALDRSLVPYLDLVTASHSNDKDVIGAVFAINGNISGVELYQTHELFRTLWPRLLRSYSVEALARSSASSARAPTALEVRRYIVAAPNTGEISLPGFNVTDGRGAIVAQLDEADGSFVHRSVIALPDPRRAAETPEGLTLRILRTGNVAGRSIARLDDDEDILIRGANSGRGWRVEVVRNSPSAATRQEAFVDAIGTLLEPNRGNSVQVSPTGEIGRTLGPAPESSGNDLVPHDARSAPHMVRKSPSDSANRSEPRVQPAGMASALISFDLPSATAIVPLLLVLLTVLGTLSMRLVHQSRVDLQSVRNLWFALADCIPPNFNQSVRSQRYALAARMLLNFKGVWTRCQSQSSALWLASCFFAPVPGTELLLRTAGSSRTRLSCFQHRAIPISVQMK
jgi:hypothetical protein